MRKEVKVFKPGDYVFAKVRGYPPWPAKILNTTSKKYSLYYYGTGETGNLSSNDLFDYFEHKKRFLTKPIKRFGYNLGIKQIDAEINKVGSTSNGNKLDATIDSIADLDTTTNKMVEAEQSLDTTIKKSQQRVFEEVPKSNGNDKAVTPSKIQNKTSNKQKDSPINKETLMLACDTDEIEPETVQISSSPINELQATTTIIGTPLSRVKESLSTSTIIQTSPLPAEEPQSTSASIQTPPSPARDAQLTSTVRTPTRDRKSFLKNVSPKTPCQTHKIKQEVMSPVSESIVTAQGVVSRSGRKIKPRRHFDDARSNSNCMTPGKRIKLQPTTPSTVNSSWWGSINVVSNSQNDTQSKGPAKSLNFINEIELENMTEPPENDLDVENVLAVLLPSDKVVALKLFKDWPNTFASTDAQTQWMQTSIKNSIRLKHELETGKIKTTAVSSQLETVSLPREELQNIKREHKRELKNKIDKILKLECDVLAINMHIVSSLKQMKPEPEECIKMMNKMLEMDVSKLMLLKYPEILSNIIKVSRYCGNFSEWNLNETETAEFNEKLPLIRKKAEECFNKFKKIFGVMDDTMFIEVFNQKQFLFKLYTHDLSVKQFKGLTEEPLEMSQPDAFSTTIITEALIKEYKEHSKSNKDGVSNKKKLPIVKISQSDRMAAEANSETMHESC